MYAISLAITVFGIVLYHICQKSIPSGAHVVGSLVLTYLAALTGSLLLLLFLPSKGFVTTLRDVPLGSVFLGIAIVAYEAGY